MRNERSKKRNVLISAGWSARHLGRLSTLRTGLPGAIGLAAVMTVLFSSMVSCRESRAELEASIQEYRISCHPDSLQWLMDHAREDHYIPIEIALDGEKLPARMRVRGDTSRGFPKKSLKIKVERADGKEETINLNAEYLDKSYMHQHISSAVFRLIGEPCFTTAFAPVFMNDEYYGLYVRVENVDEDFLVRNQLDPEGNLYKASRDGASITPQDDLDYHWEKKSNTGDSWYDLAALIADIDTCTSSSILAYVRNYFDYPSLVRHVAANIYLCNGSTYYHNYYLYHDAYGSGRWSIIAWDLDKTLSHYNWKSPFEMNNGADPDNALLMKLYMNPEFMAEVEAEITRIQKAVDENEVIGHMEKLIPRLEQWVAMDERDKIESVDKWKEQVTKDIEFLRQNDVRRKQALHDDLQPFQVCDLRTEPMLKPVFRWGSIPDFNSKGIAFDLYVSHDKTFVDSVSTRKYEVRDTLFTPELPLPPGRWYYKVVARQGDKFLTGYGRQYFVDIETPPMVPGWTGGSIKLTPQGSPYYLGSDLLIPQGKTLILMPGTRLYLDTGVSIRVDGHLVCEGTPENRISIRCASGYGAWKMLELNHCSKNVLITHTDISNGRLVYHGTDVELRHTYFRNFSADLNAMAARPSLIWGEDGNFIMDSCAMWGNQTGEGMNLHRGYPRVTHSHFTRIPDAIEFIEADSGLIAGNVVSYCKDDGIDMNACRNVRVTGNVIMHNGDKAISVGVDHHGSSRDILIEGNYLAYNRTGIDVKDSSVAVIRENVLYSHQTGIRVRQKEPGYELGGTATVERNIMYCLADQALFKVEGKSTLNQSNNFVNRELSGATYIDSTLFFAFHRTPFMASDYLRLLALPKLESSVHLEVHEERMVIYHDFPCLVDLGGCVVRDGHIGRRIPLGCVVGPGEPLVLYKGKKKNLPEGWQRARFFTWSDSDSGRLEISRETVYDLTDESGKWICKSQSVWEPKGE